MRTPTPETCPRGHNDTPAHAREGGRRESLAPALGRGTWAIAAALALLALAYTFAFSATRHGGLTGVRGDAHYIYQAARSIAEDGDIDLTNQYEASHDRWKLGRDPAADGTRLPVRELGPSLLMVPGLLVHHAGAFPERLRASFAVSLAAISIALTFAGIAASIAALARRVAHPIAAARRDALALAATLGFVVPFYALGTAGYAHAPDAAACAWLVYLAIAAAPPILFGLGVALALLMRLQNALWLVLVPLLLPPVGVAPTGPRRRALARAGALATAAALLGLAPQLYMNLAHPGSKRGAIRWDLDFFDLHHLGRDLTEVLVGVHGLLTWTPLALFACVGLLLGLADRRARPVAAGLVAVVALLTLLFACARDPNGGYAFGARRHAGVTVALGVGLALLDAALARLPDRLGRWAPRVFAALALLLVAANLAHAELALRGEVKLAP